MIWEDKRDVEKLAYKLLKWVNNTIYWFPHLLNQVS